MIKCTCGYYNDQSAAKCGLCEKTLKEAQVKELKKFRQKSIKRVSDGRDIENQLLAMFVKGWLICNPYCQIEVKGICTEQATEVHHSAGRIGYYDEWARQNNISLLLDIRFFKSGCSTCHRYAEDHPDESIKLGYSIRRTNL